MAITNSKGEWFVLIGQDCDMARSISRTPKNALAELLPAKTRCQTEYNKWANDLQSASIYSFRQSPDAQCEILQVQYQKRQFIANEILNLCAFNSDGQCRLSLSSPVPLEQKNLMPDYMIEYYTKLQHFFSSVKDLRNQAEAEFEIVFENENLSHLLSLKSFDKNSSIISFDLRRVCRLTHDYVFYLFKLYLEYRGRQPFQTINLIRQVDLSLPVFLAQEKTDCNLSFRGIPVPDKSNPKDWCWIITTSEFSHILERLKLPKLKSPHQQEILLFNESSTIPLDNGALRIEKAKKKVLFELI